MVPRVYLQFVIVVFPDHTQLLFLAYLDLLYAKRRTVLAYGWSVVGDIVKSYAEIRFIIIQSGT